MLEKFIASLASSIRKDRIGENISSLREQITTVILPSLESASRTFDKANYHGDNRDYALTYVSASKKTIKGNIITDIRIRFEKLPKLLDEIEREVKNNFGQDLIPVGMDIRKANVIRAINVIGFINKFVMTFTNVFAHNELEASGARMDYISDVTKGTRSRVSKYMSDFSIGLHGLTSVKSFESALANLPEITVDAPILGSGSANIDPMGLFTMSNFKANPTYWLSVGMAQWEADNYRDLISKRELLEFRLLMLERQNSRNPSPELESKIESLSSQVATIADKIRAIDESLA